MVQALVVLVVVGLVLYLVLNYIPMPAPFKTVITAVVILLLCLWLLNIAGVINTPKLGHVSTPISAS